ISGYGSATTMGMGMAVETEVWRDLYGTVGVDGLAVGPLRSGYSDIGRTIWGRLFWRVDDGTVLFGAIEVLSGSNTGLSLGVEEAISRQLVLRLILSDHPKRIGIGFDLRWLKPVIATFAVINTPPLGWSQRIALQFRW
ncbi:MAG: hypothetical protein P9M15_05325, partial [Candidatus Electryoneaceae bacterium]|nr:hypothetical protein [Candidatus Electryoneaceae bacterium]